MAEFKLRRTDDGANETEDGEYIIACRTCCCEVPTTSFTGNHGFKDIRGVHENPIYMCAVCYHTQLGSVLRYSDGSVSNYDLARGMVECTNIILERLRRMEEA